LTIISAFKQNPFTSLCYYIQLMVQNIYTAGVTAWIRAIPTRSFFKSEIGTLALYGAIVICAFSVIWFFLKRHETDSEGSQPKPRQATTRESIALIIFGLIAMLAASLPMWAAGLQISTVYSSDRFTLPLMFGACLALVGILELISLIPHFNSAPILILALIIGMSCGADFQTSMTFSTEWASFKAFVTQLTWRAPAIKTSTTLYAHELPLHYYGEASLSAAIDWVYAPDWASREMPYYLVYTNGDLIDDVLSQPGGEKTTVQLRGESFTPSTTQTLAMIYNPPACLHIIDPALDGLLPDLPDDMVTVLPFSNPGLIQASTSSPATLPSGLYGNALPHDWCYFYEKADLARQQSDWHQVATLGDQAAQLGFTPSEASEWLVFSEGYAHTGDWNKASQYSKNALKADPKDQPLVCELWYRIGQQTAVSNEQQAAQTAINSQASCLTPLPGRY
jgi:hypothetical protein